MRERGTSTNKSRRWVIVAGIGVLAAVALMARPVAGQFGGWQGPGQGGPGGMGPMMMGPPPSSSVAVADEKVYVVLGATVYKLDANTFEIEKQQTLVRPPQPGPPVAPAPNE